MIARSFDAAFINSVANHPEVYPWVRGDAKGPIDLAGAVENKSNVLLAGEHGGYFFLHVAPGIYDAHSLILPSGRGKWALRAARECMGRMFDNGANEILMLVPLGNLAVLALVRCLHGVFRETMRDGWIISGEKVDADVYSVTKEDWKCR